MVDLKRKPQKETLAKDQVWQYHKLGPGNTPLKYIGVQLLELAPNAIFEEKVQGELCVVVLTGKVDIHLEDQRFEGLGTRQSVFDQVPTDSLYIGKGETYTVRAVTQAKVMFCYAASEERHPAALIPAANVEIEQRGVLNNQRLVHNILTDDSPLAENLLVVEVYTSGGNWSSYPPHKHDQDNLPNESLLEELYYHEMNPSQGFVFQRVYTDDRSLDETMTVENREVVLVPRGYHPVAVPDGYESYYLNIMAGPKKVWQFHNDPAHEWILERKDERNGGEKFE